MHFLTALFQPVNTGSCAGALIEPIEINLINSFFKLRASEVDGRKLAKGAKKNKKRRRSTCIRSFIYVTRALPTCTTTVDFTKDKYVCIKTIFFQIFYIFVSRSKLFIGISNNLFHNDNLNYLCCRQIE